MNMNNFIQSSFFVKISFKLSSHCIQTFDPTIRTTKDEKQR